MNSSNPDILAQIELLIQLRESQAFKAFETLGATIIESARHSLETAQTEREIALTQGQIAGIRNLFGHMERLEMLRDSVLDTGGESAPNPGIRLGNPEE